MRGRERRERLRQRPFDEEVRVERILDEEDARFGRALGDLRPPGGRGQETRRILKIRNRVRELRLFLERALERGERGTRAVERHAHEARPVRPEERKRPRVRRRLDDDRVARIHEGARDEVEPLLRSVHDEERVRVGRDAALGEARGERLAERAVAERGAVREERAVAGHVGEERREGGRREIPLVRREARKVVGHRDRLDGRRLGEDAGQKRRRDAVPRGRGTEDGTRAGAARDARPRALVRLDPALALEELQGLVHRRAVHLERAREIARRRQALALEMPAAADVADDGVRDRPVERDA